MSGTLTAGTPSFELLGEIDVNPIGRKLVTAAKYGAFVTATATTASGALPIDVVTVFHKANPGRNPPVSTVRLVGGYDLGLGYMVPDTRSNFALTVSFQSATGGPYNLTLNYVAGPRLI